MKTSQTIAFAGLIGLITAGLLAPTIYATEDGQFPVFPTIIEGNSSSTGETIVSPATPAKTQKTTVTKTTTVTPESVKQKSYATTNESGVFSPWGYVKSRTFSNAQAGGEGVMLALEPVDAKPTARGDLQYQIFYANNTGETLRNVSIQVSLPKNFQYLDSDLRPDSQGNGVVVYDLGKVAAGGSGAIQLEVRAKKKVKDAFLSANMAYEDVDGASHTVNATASNAFNGKNGGGLSASILDGAGGFMVWLFVIILLIALAFVAYQLFVLRASSQPRT